MHSNEPTWEEQAACRDSTLDWFSSDTQEKYQCRAICQSICPVRRECIQTALTEKRYHGIWGGVDDYEIRRSMSIDAFGKPDVRNRPPRCPYCMSRNLVISGTKTSKGYKTECQSCELTWHVAVIHPKLKAKKTANKQR